MSARSQRPGRTPINHCVVLRPRSRKCCTIDRLVLVPSLLLFGSRTLVVNSNCANKETHRHISREPPRSVKSDWILHLETYSILTIHHGPCAVALLSWRKWNNTRSAPHSQTNHISFYRGVTFQDNVQRSAATSFNWLDGPPKTSGSSGLYPAVESIRIPHNVLLLVVCLFLRLVRESSNSIFPIMFWRTCRTSRQLIPKTWWMSTAE